MVWPLGKKKDKKVKNQTKTFVDGKQQEVPDKIPELQVPLPPAQEKVPEQVQLSAEEIFEEGRNVGFQEGMIHSLNHLNKEIVRIQEGLKEQEELIKKRAEAKK